MNGEILQLIDVALSVSIAAATIWIAYVANKISKLQLKMDVESQKLAWCRSCLHAMSQAVSLSELSAEEISKDEFEPHRRKLRDEIISLKNEGELFLTPEGGNPKEVESLIALKRCFDAIDTDRLPPPEGNKEAFQGRQRRQPVLVTLVAFRHAMRRDFGSVWTEHT